MSKTNSYALQFAIRLVFSLQILEISRENHETDWSANRALATRPKCPDWVVFDVQKPIDGQRTIFLCVEKPRSVCGMRDKGVQCSPQPFTVHRIQLIALCAIFRSAKTWTCYSTSFKSKQRADQIERIQSSGADRVKTDRTNQLPTDGIFLMMIATTRSTHAVQYFQWIDCDSSWLLYRTMFVGLLFVAPPPLEFFPFFLYSRNTADFVQNLWSAMILVGLFVLLGIEFDIHMWPQTMWRAECVAHNQIKWKWRF